MLVQLRARIAQRSPIASVSDPPSADHSEITVRGGLDLRGGFGKSTELATGFLDAATVNINMDGTTMSRTLAAVEMEELLGDMRGKSNLTSRKHQH